MARIRILIIDKAALARRTAASVLASDPTLEVMGTAPNARIALAKIARECPDVVVVQETDSSQDGLETLHALRQAHPLLPVLQAHNLEQSRDQFISRIKSSCAENRRAENSPWTSAPAAPGKTPSAAGILSWGRIEIVAIGASTGGPKALSALLSCLPAEFPVPLVIVQHMLPSFTGYLASQLAAQASVPITEATAERKIHPGQGWIAPGDHHMELVRRAEGVCLCLNQGSPEHSCRPSVNVLFRSVARVYGPAVLAVMLTGMGQDGLQGCEAIRAAGGQVLAQDEATSVVWGMPGAVARAGLADVVLPLEQLGPEIHRRVMKDRRRSFLGQTPN